MDNPFINNLYSTRLQAMKELSPDVYEYDKLPESFRLQIINTMRMLYNRNNAVFSEAMDNWQQRTTKYIIDVLLLEHGLHVLPFHNNRYDNVPSDMWLVFDYFRYNKTTKQALDVIETWIKAMRGLVSITQDSPNYSLRSSEREFALITFDAAISGINHRFKQHGIGYQIESDRIIKIDSTLVHDKIVKPALLVLHSKSEFKAANDYILQAYKNFKDGDYIEAVILANNAFESTLKTVCTIKKWPHDPARDTAAVLISKCLENGLFPSYLQEQLSQLRQLLQFGSTVRNKDAGHGKTHTATIPENLCSYALNLTATNILFVINQLEIVP